MMEYQKLIDQRANGKPTLVLTQDRQPLSSGKFNVGLRRAGPEMDISKVCARVKPLLPFESGGGHPYAGGLQTSDFLERDRLISVMEEGLPELYPIEIGTLPSMSEVSLGAMAAGSSVMDIGAPIWFMTEWKAKKAKEALAFIAPIAVGLFFGL